MELWTTNSIRIIVKRTSRVNRACALTCPSTRTHRLDPSTKVHHPGTHPCVPNTRLTSLDASDADLTASRPPGTAGMLPSCGIPPVARPHDHRMPPACTTACPNPRARPQGSRTPAMQPAGRPKPRRTPSRRTPCCDAFPRPRHAPRAPNDAPHPWARPRPRRTMARRRPGRPVRTYRAAARR